MSRAVRSATAGLLGLAVLLLLLAGVAVLTAPESTVTGTVLGRGWNLAGPCQPTVGYEVGGSSYRTKPRYDEEWCDEMRRDHVAVWVDADSPADGRLDRWGRLPGALGVGAVGAVLAAVLLLGWERRRVVRRAPPYEPGPVPHAAGVLALACLAAQALALATSDTTMSDDGEILLSMALGGGVVGWVAAGVLRVRGLRTALAWVLLLVGAGISAQAVLDAIGLRELATTGVGLVLSVIQLGALAWLTSTRWASWHRAHPRATGATAPTIEHLVVLAVLVGVLGAFVGQADDAMFRVHVDL